MTRSIFDPTGSETEHDGSRNLGPMAGDTSQMPPDIVDGLPEEEDPLLVDFPLDPPLADAPQIPDSEAGDAPQEAQAMDDPAVQTDGQGDMPVCFPQE
jgi:hypothetical protein